MDDCLREMGVGDLSVPKKVKRAAAELHAALPRLPPRRWQDDEARWPPSSPPRFRVLNRGPGSAPAETRPLRAARARGPLAALPAAELLDGRVTFPSPATPCSLAT